MKQKFVEFWQFLKSLVAGKPPVPPPSKPARRAPVRKIGKK